MFKDKGLIIGIVVTIILILGGVFFMTKDNSTSSVTDNKPVSNEILVPQGEFQTSGFIDGNYLPASSSAKVTVVEFGDYECPACGVSHPFIQQLLSEFPGKINFVFRNFPLTQHKNAQISAQFAEAAGLQGKYWQMHSKLFETQSEWSSSTNPRDVFTGYATALGIDMTKLNSDISSKTVNDNIQKDINDGNLVNLTYTPTYYVNGVKIDTVPSNYNDFKNIITKELSK